MSGFTFNSIAFTPENGFHLMGLPEYLSGSAYKITQESKLAEDGGIYYFGGRDTLIVVVEFAAVASGIEELYEKIDHAKMSLSPENGEAVLKFSLEEGLNIKRQYVAIPFSPVTVNLVSEYGATLRCEFLVPTGKAETQTEYTEDIVIDTDPENFSIPSGSGEVVNGTAKALPVWTFSNTGATVSNLILTNNTTGDVCRWQGFFAPGTKLRFDAKRKHVERSIDGGTTWTSAVSGLYKGNIPVHLKPGVVNSIGVSGFTAGSLSVVYRGSFI